MQGYPGYSPRSAEASGRRSPPASAPPVWHSEASTPLGFVGGPAGLETTGFLPEGDPTACEDFDACSLGHETSLSLTAGFVGSFDTGLEVAADV